MADRPMSKQKQAELAALAKAVGELVEQGLTLPEIAARRGMPSLDSLQRWLSKVHNLSQTYDRAAERRAEVMADTVVAIADAAAGDSLAGAKLRMDARKWRAALFRKDADRQRPAADDGPVTDEVIRRLEEANERYVRFERAEREEDEREAKKERDWEEAERRDELGAPVRRA